MNMPSIQVVVGLILIILFYSLLTTILMEFIASLLALRGKHLEKVLKNLLSSSDRNETLFNEFKRSPFYMQLSGSAYGKKSAPSYLSAKNFREILVDIIQNRKAGSDFQDKIQDLPDYNLRKVLDQFYRDTGQDFTAFFDKIESWYDDIMDRAGGWYKRNVQIILLVMGLGVAIGFNVDALHVFNHLMVASESDLNQLMALAEEVSETVESGEESPILQESIYLLIDQNLEKMKNPLGVGWYTFQVTYDLEFWLLKVIGWLITAFALSKGAPFWFDLLNKIMRFRDTGKVPHLNKLFSESSQAIPSGRTGDSSTGGGSVATIDKPVG